MADLITHGLYPDRRTPKIVSRAKSSNALADMAAVVAHGAPGSRDRDRDRDRSENSLSTLRDPRVASTSDLSRTTSASSASHHPDLSNEVANLSDKLIQAINHQTLLDDSLAVVRQELEEERRKRSSVEKEKKGIETELETLTAALFEEANKMVAAAKKEREAVERKNEQLRAKIKDTELLLASHQEQLAELKSVIEQMNSRHDELDTSTTSTSTNSPFDPFPEQSHINRLFEAMNLSPVTPGSDDISPAPSTSFTHLLKPVCRTDILAYEDFHTLLQLSRSRPPSRVGSGSYSGLNVMNLANLASSRPKSTTHTPTNSQDTNNNTNSPAGPHSFSSSSPPAGISSSPRENITSSMQLKETRFYKRILTEDIEPTLRLDMAPGISWLTRRSVMSSIVEGELIIEPIPTANGSTNPEHTSPPSTPSSLSSSSTPCSLCGDRRSSENPRTHRFRTSSSDNAPRHVLCGLCLEKMRSCCDFVGYLRLVVDGHVRTGGGEGEGREREKEAWEETIRLRERIFWARVGGGVVPAFVLGKKDESEKEVEQNGDMNDMEYELVIKDVTVVAPMVAKDISLSPNLLVAAPPTSSSSTSMLTSIPEPAAGMAPTSAPETAPETAPESVPEIVPKMASEAVQESVPESVPAPTTEQKLAEPQQTPGPGPEQAPNRSFEEVDQGLEKVSGLEQAREQPTSSNGAPTTLSTATAFTTSRLRTLSPSPSRYRSRSPSPAPSSLKTSAAVNPPRTESPSNSPSSVTAPRVLRRFTPVPPTTPPSDVKRAKSPLPITLRATSIGTSSSKPAASTPEKGAVESKLKVKIPAAFLHDT